MAAGFEGGAGSKGLRAADCFRGVFAAVDTARHGGVRERTGTRVGIGDVRGALLGTETDGLGVALEDGTPGYRSAGANRLMIWTRALPRSTRA